MDLHDKLARERRARLAAERLLERKSRELFDANRRLALQARALSEEVDQTRQAADELRGCNDKVMTELAEVSKAFTVAKQRLWDSLETVRDGFALFGADDRLVIGNKAFFDLFEGLEEVIPGIRYDEIIRLAVEEGVFDIGQERPQEYAETLLSRWHLDPVPPRVVRLWTGEYLKLTDRRTPSGDMVCLAINITDMMRMWAALEAIPDAFVLYDAEDRLVMCNDRYREFYAESAQAMVPGARFEDILRQGLANGQYPEAVGREEDWLTERLVNHQKASSPVEQRLADGRWLRIFEQRTPDGGIVGLRVDITEQKRQQEALEQARVAAEAANRAKSAFLANMSHELRTPMNGVVGMAEILCETEMSEEQRLYAHTIRESGEALLGLLNDVLDYSKIEADKLTLNPAPFDLERIIHEVVTLLQAPARDKRLDMLIDYDIFLPTRFIGDGARLRQILTNLVGNAVKFTEEGHVLVRVVGFEDASGRYQIHLIVEDSGIGIAPDLQEHIFGEFNQVDDQENRKFEGTGLGLAITKRLIEMMEGEIWLVSGKGEGACFGIRLTLPVCEEADALPAAPATRARRVLVVDDQEVNRTILERQLGQLGLEVVSHICGELALQETGRFDLVVTDHRMPGMDGMSLARALRDGGYDGPILMLSSNPTRMRAADDPVASGVDLVLQKPLLRRALYEAVAQLAPPAAGQPARLPAPPAPAGAPVAPDAVPMRILAAEDNRTNRLVLEKMLDGLALDIRFVKDGDEAVAAFSEARPDLILMDISMPGCDGKEATRRIRALEAGSDLAPVPVVALTAHAMIDDVDAILAAGLNGCLTKPLRKAEIVETLEAYRPDGCLPIRMAGTG
ncbi:signal transduction histidine kinase/DNA-binding response OmpR family regulator [Rhodovulum sulfidophilum]|uniref:hybrid sensor histidine kinase/response regulator n=1 Tax=Rhodovulum sulfidophilum TaxID=35806 RepID=UPI0005A8B005|nr:response regulator [Rhodovulum sulfidophilum]ANB33396.1 hybrid sensor histidine kinase/response regulator [Rhodovulum sulfidophilum DSM 1374]ANB37217.1 hybrid sensor histidine kinase/response regulator [Rhodovulum sulfidophilum]MCW2304370.1 signal transduction histidine kinase/DNA-binding response OmpR family regulator [Rhodovulum sulfidophilum]